MAKNNVSRRTFVTLAGGAAAVPAAAAQGRKAVVSPAAMNMATPQAQGDPIKIVTTHQFAPNEIRQIEQAAAPPKWRLLSAATAANSNAVSPKPKSSTAVSAAARSIAPLTCNGDGFGLGVMTTNHA